MTIVTSRKLIDPCQGQN